MLRPALMSCTMFEKEELDYSRKSPLLIMHDFFDCRQHWEYQARRFCNELNEKVITLDARNHGETGDRDQHTYFLLSEDIRYFLNQYEIEKCKLIGHGMGGSAAMQFCLSYPNVVECLAVVEANPIGTSLGLQMVSRNAALMKQANFKGCSTIYEARAAAAFQLSVLLQDETLANTVVENVIEAPPGKFKWRVNLNVLEREAVNIRNFFIPTHAEYYYGPAVFVSGSYSNYLPKHVRGAICGLFPNAGFIELSGGHDLHKENANDLFKALARFFKFHTGS